MKTNFLFILLCLCSQYILGQNIDSTTFVNADWSKTKVKYKVYLYKYHFNNKNLFNSNQNISYVEIKKGCFSPKIQIGYEKQQRMTTSEFGKKHRATAAINGSFFDVKNGGSVNYLKINNELIDTNRLISQNIRTQRALAIVGIDKKGKLHVAKLQNDTGWENGFLWPDILAGGPILQYNTTIEPLDTKDKFNITRHPRTAIGVKANGNVLLLTIDGRNANSQGVDMWELQKIMRWLGCTSSMNLDGGGSTTLWIKGFGDNGVVNYPSDNKLWDHFGERKVANTIIGK